MPQINCSPARATVSTQKRRQCARNLLCSGTMQGYLLRKTTGSQKNDWQMADSSGHTPPRKNTYGKEN
jgi:hypothetical protein